MTMTKSDVKVNIATVAAPTRAGFGYPLIMAGGVSTENIIPYTECASLEDVVSAGFTTESEVYQAAQLMLMQTNAPEKFAVYAAEAQTAVALTDIMDKGWRQLLCVTEGTEADSTVTAIGAVIATCDSANGKIYFANGATATDYTAAGDRTVVFYYPQNEEEEELPVCPAAALVGATAGKAAGSITYKNVILTGLSHRGVADSDLAYEKSGKQQTLISVVAKAGDIVTTEGMTVSGEYIDVIDAKDYIVQQIVYGTQQLLNQYDKIPYDNTGIGLLENVCVNVLKDAYNNGIIATDDEGGAAYSVDYGLRSETAAADRAARNYILGAFTATLAGAVHTVTINGTIEI